MFVSIFAGFPDKTRQDKDSTFASTNKIQVNPSCLVIFWHLTLLYMMMMTTTAIRSAKPTATMINIHQSGKECKQESKELGNKATGCKIP